MLFCVHIPPPLFPLPCNHRNTHTQVYSYEFFSLVWIHKQFLILFLAHIWWCWQGVCIVLFLPDLFLGVAPRSSWESMWCLGPKPGILQCRYSELLCYFSGPRNCFSIEGIKTVPCLFWCQLRNSWDFFIQTQNKVLSDNQSQGFWQLWKQMNHSSSLI